MYGFSVHRRARRIDPLWLERFRGIPVANVSDVMWRSIGGGARIRPMHDGTAMAGAALTVRSRPGDNLMLHKALQIAVPGDIIVCECGGDLTNSLFGEIMLQYAAHQQVAGVVLDGAIRDAGAIRRQSLPVYAAGITHRGPYKDGPGEINVPIAIDGMVIEPGDLVIGDDDGVLCIPFDAVEQIHADARVKIEQETETLASGAAGKFDTAWIDIQLSKRGCSFED